MNFAKLREFMDSLPEYTKIPGAEIAVWQEHRRLFRYAVGVRDLSTGEPMRGDELYFFYSATKPVTCAAVMQLVEGGRLGLNDPVSLYLPEYASVTVKREDGSVTPAENRILIRHLLTMTAGMSYRRDTPEVMAAIAAANGRASTRELVRAFAAEPLAFEPGEKWRYSLCHDVLAAVVEVVSGMRFSEYLKEFIFRPLGMKNSSMHAEPSQIDRIAAQYDWQNEETVQVPKVNQMDLGPEYDAGGAGLVSCLDDYILFTDAMANGGVGANGNRILHANTIELMRENQVGNRMETDCPWPQLAGYGYGFGVRTMISRGKGGSLGPIGEFGWDGAKGAYLIIDPEHHLSMCYLEHRGSHKELLQPRLRNLLYTCLADSE